MNEARYDLDLDGIGFKEALKRLNNPFQDTCIRTDNHGSTLSKKDQQIRKNKNKQAKRARRKNR